ncbi:hypothetical protein T296_07810 [Pantoea agglomerans Eh318]|nr:hypothetical protein T296_07810 [Pantoea agglomerans Eh318]
MNRSVCFSGLFAEGDLPGGRLKNVYWKWLL